MTTLNFEKLVADYVKLRDAKAAMSKRQEEEMAPINRALTKIESLVLEGLNNIGAESMRTQAGTVYKYIRTNAKVVDRAAFLEYVARNNMSALLDVRANKSSIEEHLEEFQQVPAGVDVTRSYHCGFRRG